MKNTHVSLFIIALLSTSITSFAQDDMWINAIGKTQDSHEIQLIHKKLGKPDIPEQNVSNTIKQIGGKFSPWYKKGLDLSFAVKEYQMLRAITFHNIDVDSEYSQYKQKLPFGLSFSDSPKTLASKFGKIEKIENENSKEIEYYKIMFDQKKHPELFLYIRFKNDKIANISLTRDVYKSFSPFKIEPNGTDCEMIATIFKDHKYDFSHIRGTNKPADKYDFEWPSLLNPSFSKKTTLESDLIHFEIYSGPDFDLAAKTLSAVNGSFIKCVREQGYVFNMVPREEIAPAIEYYSDDENLYIEALISQDTETLGGKEQIIYPSTITVKNYKEYEDCDLFEHFYENAKTDFRYLKRYIIKEDIVDTWDTNIPIYNNSRVTIERSRIILETYNGDSLDEANSALVKVYNLWDECKKQSNQAFIFIKDDNTLDTIVGSRKITYISYDDIAIQFEIDKSFKFDGDSRSNNYNTSVSLYLKD